MIADLITPNYINEDEDNSYSWWCVNCVYLGSRANDNGRYCIKCLSDSLERRADNIPKPVGFKEGFL